ncbi:high affinity sulfate transporter 2-like [Alnus glutinosa]|uniref:high affinity sulfate transporter 2-like n=1 Tax=Alnus glutinosa TaxID=3517 RepID=UPI002D76990C|nr:high affinity sulfate transporter 2-like [Alnus glutinosa]XP_062177625.1 high affinity sulfate transporter 2-like [Alnus glutinosa]
MSRRVTDDPETNEMEIASGPSSRRHPAVAHHIHRVEPPQTQNAWKEFRTGVKEIFFYDEPLRHFKDESAASKFLLVLQGIFPILDWGRSYRLQNFKGDLVAGLTIASLCVPQDIAYAKLANLDPQYGLYSSFVPPLVYAFMGSSRHIAIGPVAVVSLLLGTLLQNEINSSNKLAYKRLAFTATFFAGVTQFALGFFRLGFLIDFLSHAAIVGFMGGAAVTIALQQLKGLLGITNFTKKTDIVSVMHSVWGTVHHGWNWQTIIIGLSFLVFLLITKYIGKKYPKLFWVSAMAPLISVIVATFCVAITHADRKGVAIVKHIQKGINPSSVHEIYWTGEFVLKGLKIGVVAGMIGLTEGVAIGRTFASMNDYQLDGNKEMVAFGSMNIIGSLTSCYVTTGSFSRSAVNYMAGCSTTVSNIVMSLVVLLTLELITPLFKYTPNAVLASIIIAAVIGLIDIKAALLLWKIDKLDFIACMGAFFGVVFKSVEIGLLIAVAISFAKILLQVTRPRTAKLGKLPGTNVYRNIVQYSDAKPVPGTLIVRVDSAIYFSNSNYIKERILRWLSYEEEEVNRINLPRIQYLVIEMSPVTDIDTSGIHSFEELHRSLQHRNIRLALANPAPIVTEKLYSSEFATLIGEKMIFPSVADAVLTLPRNQEP